MLRNQARNQVRRGARGGRLHGGAAGGMAGGLGEAPSLEGQPRVGRGVELGLLAGGLGEEELPHGTYHDESNQICPLLLPNPLKSFPSRGANHPQQPRDAANRPLPRHRRRGFGAREFRGEGAPGRRRLWSSEPPIEPRAPGRRRNPAPTTTAPICS
jgi:hypothetical protein